MGILAPWGQGKTSLMRMIRRDMGYKPRENATVQDYRVETKVEFLDDWIKAKAKPKVRKLAYPTVWFNAWKYQSGEQIWAGLADAIITQLVQQIDTEAQREEFWLAMRAERLDPGEIRQDIRRLTFERFFPKVRGSAVFGMASAAIAGVSALASAVVDNQVFTDGSQIAAVAGVIASLGGTANGWRKWGESSDEVKKEPLDGSLARLVRRPDYEGMQGLFHQVELDVKRVFDLLVDPDKPAVVFIDDLDRCSPGRLAEVLEAVNLFLSGDFRDCYFVVGMDAQLAAASMEVAHRELNTRLQRMTRRYGSLGWYFMDKFIQLPFVIPNVDQPQSRDYLSGLFKQSADSVAEDDPEGETEEQKEEKDADAARRIAANLENKSVKASDLRKLLAPDLIRLRRNRPDEFQQYSRRAIERGAQEFTDDDPEIKENLVRYGEFFGGNPRTMKRFANLYRFYRHSQWSREVQGLDSASPSALGRWLVVMLRWPQLVRWIQWESESQLDGDATPTAKAAIFEEDLKRTDSFEEWTVHLTNEDLDQLARLVDRPLYEFLHSPSEDHERLSRATEVGVW